MTVFEELREGTKKIPPDRVQCSAGRYFVRSEYIPLYPIHSFTFEGASGISVQ